MAKRATRRASTDATPSPPTTRRRGNNRPVVPFPYKLILNQWLLSLFNVDKFEKLAEHLKNESLEGSVKSISIITSAIRATW